MSLHDYTESKRMNEGDPPFAAWIMGAYRKADTGNALLLRSAWPEIIEEMQARYDAPGGLLAGGAHPEPSLEERICCCGPDAISAECHVHGL